jgi:2-octaprenyl-6-methoxyphenol hydroxylase
MLMPMKLPEARKTPALVVGAGPAGLAAALALAEAGVAVEIAAPRLSADMRARDTRTFAALGGSVTFLETLGIVARLSAAGCTALKAIRLVDDRGGFLRAPEVLFEAHELGREAFGLNITHAALGAALADAVDARGIIWHDSAATGVAPASDHVIVSMTDGRVIAAQLVAAADGRRSLARAAVGITTRDWSYPQSALACVFGHGRAHDSVSTEWHRTHGPFTTVPLPDDADGPRSSLVWVDAPPAIDELQGLSEIELASAIERRLHGLLGRVRHVGPRAVFPLSGLETETMARGRIVLIGEAGHVVPPIGAQGLNLGLRDAAALHDAVIDHGGSDPGNARVIEAYARARAADVWSRTRMVDALNRTLFANLLPLDAARGLGLHALAASATLRRAAMRRGLDAIGGSPRLMRSAHSTVLA